MGKISSQVDGEKIYELAKKSILYKPFVFNKMYSVSGKNRQAAVNKEIEKFIGADLKAEELQKLRCDLVYCKVFYNISYEEYFLFGFRKKGHLKRKNFIPNKGRNRYFNLLRSRAWLRTLENKYKTYELFKDYYKREMIQISNEADFELFCDFIKDKESFVKKPIDGSFGKGIELVSKKDNENVKALFQELLKEGKVILEERIISDEKMASLHPSSLNTVRLVTYKNENGEVTIHLPFIKIGQKGSFVDNGGAGGILALIDSKTGVIATDGKDELNNIYKVHPDTKVELKGFQVPQWQEMIDLVKEACKKYPDTNYIGWDVAASNKGPLVVEANGQSQFYGQQMCDEIGKRKDLERLINYKKIRVTNKHVYKGTEPWDGKYKFSVIIAIKNLERHLEDSINSIVKQTIGFKDSVQLILINDGSTDNSEKICLRYKELYPDNVVYEVQRSDGEANAKNYGLSFAEGKYINFFDGRGKWAHNSFKLVWNFFEENYTDTNVVTCRQRDLEDQSDYGIFDYRFQSGTNLYSINKNPDYIQIDITSSFILKSSINETKFDGTLYYAEDTKFVNDIILKKKSIGLIKEAECFIRKENEKSLTNLQDKSLLTELLKNFNKYYQFSYDYSLKVYGYVIPYVQHLIMNELKYRIKDILPETSMTKGAKEEYINGILRIVKMTDDEVIFNMRNVDYQTKLYLLKLKHNDFNEHLNGDEQCIPLDSQLLRKKMFGITMIIADMSINNDRMMLSGVLQGNPYINPNSIVIKKGQQVVSEVQLTEAEELEQKSILNESINTIFPFNYTLALNKDVTTYKFFAKVNGKLIKIKPNFEQCNGLLQQKNWMRIGNKMILQDQYTLIAKNYKLIRAVKSIIKK